MSNQLILSRGKRNGIFAILGVLILLLATYMSVKYVNTEQIVVKESILTGERTYWTESGPKAQLFGRITTYYKTNQVWFNEVNESSNGDLNVNSLKNPAFPITYADKGKGYVLGSVRVELPTRSDKLELIQQHYASEHRLVEELIKPTIGKAILASGPLMTSLESVSEKRNDLIYYVTDQLNNGIYSTKAVTVERINSITGEKEKVQQAEIVTDSTAIDHIKRAEESPFDKYGLRVSQLSVADLKYEHATNEQISKQRAADMEIITAKAEAAKAQQRTIQITEEGRQSAEQAKWEQETIKAKAVVAAEQEYEVAALEAKRAKEVAEKIRQEGIAAADANRALVSAGLTPLEKATIEKETKIGVAKALAGYQGDWVPKVVGGGSGSSNNQAMDAMGIKMMLDIIEKIEKK